MSQQLAHGDHLFVSAFEFGQIMPDGAVECQFAELDAARAQHAGYEWFCERSEIVDRVELVSDAIRFDEGMAQRVSEDYLVAFAYEVDCRGKLTGADMFGEKTRQLFVTHGHWD